MRDKIIEKKRVFQIYLTGTEEARCLEHLVRYEKKMNVFSEGEMAISNATFPVRFSVLICTVILRPLTEAWTNFFVFCSFFSLF